MRNNRNEATGNIIHNGIKGDSEAYADGWDRIFGKKEEPKVEQKDEPNEPLTPADS